MPATLKKSFPAAYSPVNEISFYHLALLLMSLPYDRFYSHLILISFTLHTLINLRKPKIKPLLTLTNAALTSVCLLTLAGTIYTTNKTEAFNEWAKQITILLFPVVFCLNSINLKKYRKGLLLIFALSSTVAILLLYLLAFRAIRFYHFPIRAVFSPDFTNHNFSGPFDIHATFFSMQIALALVFLITELLKAESARYKLLCIFCCVVLAAGIIQLSSKSVFVALLLIINIAVPLFLLKGAGRIKYLAITASLSAITIFGIYRLDTFKGRYITDFKTDLSSAKANELFDPRLARWEVALKLVATAPVIGHGSGSEIGLLKERFFEHKFYRSYLAGLNAHNQFISLLIKTGVVGLLVYLATLYFGFRKAVLRQDILLFAFMVIIAMVSISENFLDVDKGIFFYSVFFSLFIFSKGDKTAKSYNINGMVQATKPAFKPSSL